MTAELAVGMPVVALLLLALLALAAAGVAQTRAIDAARAGARAAALGDSDAQVTAVVRRVAGEAATVTVSRDGGWVTVDVSAGMALGPWGSPVPVRAEAVARAEP